MAGLGRLVTLQSAFAAAAVNVAILQALVGGLCSPSLLRHLTDHPRVVDRFDTLGVFSMMCLVAAMGNGIWSRLLRLGGPSVYGPLAAWAVVSTVILLDRLLLVLVGLPLWIPDPVMHFQHRKEAVRTLAYAGRPRTTIRINSLGHHDTEIVVPKPDGEFRALVLGDSVAMAFGLTYAETFSGRIEDLLAGRTGESTSYEFVNTAVQGHSTIEQAEMLRRSWYYDPDIIVITFCLNDFTDPLLLRTQFGGTGVNDNRVVEAQHRWVGLALNETGFGRFLGSVQWRQKRSQFHRLAMRLDLRTFFRDGSRAEVQQAWMRTTNALEDIYGQAAAKGVPVLFMSVPASFQLRAEKQPQDALLAHAANNGAHFLDLRPALHDAVFEDFKLLEWLESNQYSEEQQMALFQAPLGRYYLDQLHLTALGHRVIARELLSYLQHNDLLR